MSPRDVIFGLLDAIAANDWQRTKELARQARRVSPYDRRVLIRKWCEDHRQTHPNLVQWIELKTIPAEQPRSSSRQWNNLGFQLRMLEMHERQAGRRLA